jgi:hypothetical protein
MSYGGPYPSLTPSYAGFQYGDTASSFGFPASCKSVSVYSPVGSYPVTCSGAASPNYDFTYVQGVFTITPAQLWVTAPNLSIPYGTAIPQLTPSYSRLYGIDTPASLTDQPTCTTSATSSSPVGTYPITCSGGVDANYSFTYVPGSLTITRTHTVLSAGPYYVLSGLLGSGFSATLTNGASKLPIAGQLVAFSVGGSIVCSATTSATGLATCQPSLLTFLSLLGASNYTATYAGTPNLYPATQTEPVALAPGV